MGELEEMMFKSIRTVLLKSVENYKEIERPEWMLNHPGQCVLNGSQIHWTTEVEEAMEQNKLAEYVQFLNVQISETVKKVQEEVTKLQSITIGALITIDVHAKEVVQDLADLNVTDITAFDWIS
jgi:dynein heavy chain